MKVSDQFIHISSEINSSKIDAHYHLCIGLARMTRWTGSQDKMDLPAGQYGLARRTRWTGPQDNMDWPAGQDGLARRTRWTGPQDKMD